MNIKAVIFILGIFLVLAVVFFYTERTISRLNISSSVRKLYLKKVTDIPLSGGANRLDYQSINYENNRLYISHLGSNQVIVVDLMSQKVIKDIELPSSPYGILAVPQLHKVYVGVGGNNQVAVIDENSLQVTKYIPGGVTPDGLVYDPNTKKIFVSNENGGTIAVIDARRNERITDIPVGESVGNTQYDPVSHHIFSVSGQDNTLVEIDPATDNIIQKFKTNGCSHPHGFYIDENTQYAFITCQENNKMIVFDLNQNEIIGTDTVGADPDVLSFDPDLHRLYVAAESGVLTIFTVQKNNIAKIGQFFLANNAHTVNVNKSTHEVYFPLENVKGKPVLEIYKEL